MKTYFRFIVVMSFAFVTSAQVRAVDDPDDIDAPLPKIKGEYVSDRAAAIMTGATRVETFRIAEPRKSKASRPATLPADYIDRYVILAKGKTLDKDFAARLAKVALDGKTYARPSAMCFDPGVAFRFWKGDESADMLICFYCDNILMQTTGKDDGICITFHAGRGRPPMVRLVKEAFPDDSQIRELKEDRVESERRINVKEEIGERAFVVLTGATRVQGFRIHELRAGRSDPGNAPKFGKYVIDDSAKEQGVEFAAKSGQFFADPRAYNTWNAPGFSPDAAYRFWKGEDSVDVLISVTQHHVRIGEKLLNLSDRGETGLEFLLSKTFPTLDEKKAKE